MFRVRFSQGKSEYSEEATSLEAAQSRARQWCCGWSERTRVEVLDADGVPVFAVVNTALDARLAAARGVSVRVVECLA